MQIQYHLLCLGAILFFCHLPDYTRCSPQGDLTLFRPVNERNYPECVMSMNSGISRWANRLGKELWDLGEIITKKHDIENNYIMAKLETKDPKQIISEIVGNVSYMMRKKMDAVNCILDAAEKAAEEFNTSHVDHNYTYHRSMPLQMEEDEDKEDEDTNMSLPMQLNSIIQFFNFTYLEEDEDRKDKARAMSLPMQLNSIIQFFNFTHSEEDEDKKDENKDEDMYLPMKLNNDTHFFNLLVNINHSSVHVPTNIYHKHQEAEIAIRWSEVLHETFHQNYKADPALSWQYFGSSSGILRHYPAMNWDIDDKGLFDCRIRTWFIEAATCTKDIVLLVDTSGSMTGWSIHLAIFTVKTILQTLSNNDYVNIIVYSESVRYLVPCFEDKLIQATQENIAVFEDALKTLVLEDKSFVDAALDKAFALLRKYRIIRQCDDDDDDESTGFCNQAIMVISDGFATNKSKELDVFDISRNESSDPIRIFTFLVGTEPAHLGESILMACTHRGYHNHVNSLEQVTSSVYKYVLVLARPLVLQREDHPLSWTHAYYDRTFDLGNKTSRRFEKYRLLTSVAGPAFNLTAYDNNVTKTAELLGVAGTDVPIDDISKLMYHYKTGVNSHSFVVSNNGYVLKHPDLRPMLDGVLKDNYNSIDLTEVEQLDDNTGPREIGDTLLHLRHQLVYGIDGVIHDVEIKYHYDDMRRVSKEINDYYFAPINDTPFSIGFAIPDLYGNYSIEVGEEIESHRFSPINISSYFTGSHWKIHPKWDYCKYHYLEGHEFDNPEIELVHFINRMNTDGFEWSMQYEVKDQKQDVSCGAITLEEVDYYCDKNLVERLVFDAKHTKPAFEEPWTHRNREENNLRLLYNASLRFVATMSGLTRWEYISKQGNDTQLFGNEHPKAIDEIWYKSAVIQHRFSDNSFVYSVPFEYDNDEDLLVTGSFAIFLKKDDIEAPGAVVGLQFSHSHLWKRFLNITAASHTCRECLLCGDQLECYVIDSSGYIIISRDKKNTGKFFGDIEGVAMETMLYKNIFEKVTIRDYQAICFYYQWVRGSGNTLLEPIQYLVWIIQWFVGQIAWLFIKMNLHQFWDPSLLLVNAIEYAKKLAEPQIPHPTIAYCGKNCKREEEEWHAREQIARYSSSRTACDTERDLYVLNQKVFTDMAFLHMFSEEIILEDCVRPFYVKIIPHSNLLLIAIETSKEESCYFYHSTALRDIAYDGNETFPCHKLYLNNLTRRTLKGCYSENPAEREITDCGKCGRIHFYINLLIMSIGIFIMQMFCYC